MISVPNKCPFKEKILIDAEKQRAELKELKVKKKEEAKKLNLLEKKKKVKETKKTKQSESTNEFENSVPKYIFNFSDLQNQQSSKNVKIFAGEVRKTIETADVVFEVYIYKKKTF